MTITSFIAQLPIVVRITLPVLWSYSNNMCNLHNSFIFKYPLQKKYFQISFEIQTFSHIFVSVFHRILDFTRGWISIRPFSFFQLHGKSKKHSIKPPLCKQIHEIMLFTCSIPDYYFVSLPTQ